MLTLWQRIFRQKKQMPEAEPESRGAKKNCF
jgi:hypothetical protein